MPVKLKLLPQYTTNANYSQDVIQMEEEDALFERIIGMEQEQGRRVQEPFDSYLGSQGVLKDSYGPTRETLYGDPVKEVTALDLKLVMQRYRSPNWRNNAAIAYVMQLPNELSVWLYWH